MTRLAPTNLIYQLLTVGLYLTIRDLWMIRFSANTFCIWCLCQVQYTSVQRSPHRHVTPSPILPFSALFNRHPSPIRRTSSGPIRDHTGKRLVAGNDCFVSLVGESGYSSWWAKRGKNGYQPPSIRFTPSNATRIATMSAKVPCFFRLELCTQVGNCHAVWVVLCGQVCVVPVVVTPARSFPSRSCILYTKPEPSGSPKRNATSRKAVTRASHKTNYSWFSQGCRAAQDFASQDHGRLLESFFSNMTIKVKTKLLTQGFLRTSRAQLLKENSNTDKFRSLKTGCTSKRNQCNEFEKSSKQQHGLRDYPGARTLQRESRRPDNAALFLPRSWRQNTESSKLRVSGNLDAVTMKPDRIM